MHDDNDTLLHVVSARMALTWKAFKDAFETLYMAHPLSLDTENSGLPNWALYQTARALDQLGHCDFSWTASGNQVFAAPPVLARLPIAGLPQAVLTGARAPKTLTMVRQVCHAHAQPVRVYEHPQKDQTPGVPARIALQADTHEALEEVALALNIPYANKPPAWALTACTASLNHYLDTRPAPKSGELVGWEDRADFQIESLWFGGQYSSAPNVRLSRYTHPITSRSHFFLWQEGQRIEVDRSWGIYSVLSTVGHHVCLYDRKRFMFATPIRAPLPRLLARSLCLCSGYAPTIAALHPPSLPDIGKFHVYRWVPPEIAQSVVDKMNQCLIDQDIEIA